eukprot:PhF_6_TR8356/c0_g1_i1/m.13107
MLSYSDARVKSAIAPTGNTGTRESNPIVLGKNFPTYAWVDFLVAYPTLIMIISALIPLGLSICVVVLDYSIDVSAKGFELSDHETVLNRNLYQEALDSWESDRTLFNARAANAAGAKPPNFRNTPKYRLYVTYKIDVSRYKGVGTPNLLRKETLNWIRDVEQGINLLNGYEFVCWMNNMKEQGIVGNTSTDCAPLNSILSYFYPGTLQQYRDFNYQSWYNWEFTGVTGSYQEPLKSVVSSLLRNDNYRWFVDGHFGPTIQETIALRTQITIGTPIQDFYNSENLTSSEEKRVLEAFLLHFRDYMESSAVQNHPFISVSYGGDRLVELIIAEMLQSDWYLLLISAFIVWVAMALHMHSIALAFCGTWCILITPPTGLCLYILISKNYEISILSSLATFVMCAIGMDNALIMFTTFTHSGCMISTGRTNMLSMEQRMAFTYRKAGTGVLLSNLIALCCFVINAISRIQAVKSFGGQMITVTLVNAYLFLVFFPAAILFHHFNLSGRRRNVQKKRDILREKNNRYRHPVFVELLDFEAMIDESISIPRFPQRAATIQARTEEEVEKRLQTRPGYVKRTVTGFFRRSQSVTAQTNDEPPPAPEMDPGTFADAPEGITGRDLSTLLLDVRRKPFPLNRVVLPPSEVFWPQLEAAQAEQISDESNATTSFSKVANNLIPQFLPQTTNVTSAEGGTLIRRATSLLRVCTLVLSGTLIVITQDRHPMCEKTEEEMQATNEPSPEKRKRRFWEIRGRVADWWTDREQAPRAFCCGLFGRRVNETVEQRERRILSSRQKHEGYSWLERIVLSKVGAVLYKGKWVFLVSWLAILVGFAIAAAGLQPESGGVSILGENPLGKYDTDVNIFPVKGRCDYCSAYYRPRSDFPTPSPDAVAECENVKSNGQQIFSTIDVCGVCDGNSTCVDCTGVARLGADVKNAWVTDSCGQCLPSNKDSRWNKCMDVCTNNPSYLYGSCSFCYKSSGPVGLNWFGPSCTVYCDEIVCPVNRGTCNPYTGKCECFQSFEKGFFKNDDALADSSISPQKRLYCTLCESGFIPEIGTSPTPCIAECNSTYPNNNFCVCDTDKGRCNCPGILLGPHCLSVWTSKCVHGEMDSRGNCVCDADWSDGASCATHRLCSFHGDLMLASQVPPGAEGCQCKGFWRGPTCSVCGCRNGGLCNAAGACTCQGAWSGLDCSLCNSVCSKHGSCPIPFKPENYFDAEACKGVFCLHEELIGSGNPTTPDCTKCFHREKGLCYGLASPSFISPTSPPLVQVLDTPAPTSNGTSENGTNTNQTSSPNTTTPAPSTSQPPTATTLAPQPLKTCIDNSSCYWDSTLKQCYVRFNYIPPTNDNQACRSCKGNFKGTLCETCVTPVSGLQCRDTDGVLVGCDGQPKNKYGQYQFIDSCGICGGKSTCSGCDGVSGSKKKYDQCGVCGGFDECLLQNVGRTSAVITVAFGLGLSSPLLIHTETIQRHLAWVCDQLNSREDLSQGEKSRCFWTNFVDWLNDDTKRTLYNFETLQFPFVPSNPYLFYRALFLYAKESGNFDLIGFTSSNIDEPTLRLSWFAFEIRTASVYVDDDLDTLQNQYNLWKTVISNINSPPWLKAVSLEGVMVSEAWVNMFTRLNSISSGTYVIVVGGIITFAVVLVVSCSIGLTLMNSIVVLTSVVVVLGMFQAVGWTFGPVEQLGMSTLLGLCAARSLNMMEGYVETLHGSQSHMFARETTREHSFRGTFLRVGVPVVASSMTLIILSLLQLASHLYVFRKMATMLLIIFVTSFLVNITLFGPFLGAMGPVISRRSLKKMGVVGLLVLVIGGSFTILILFAFRAKNIEGDPIVGKK